jgi:hypothetical protein
MFKYNNTHIFTGYLKQLLSSFNLPACKVYTSEFADYLNTNGKEDPRVVESFNEIKNNHTAVRVPYLKGNGLYNYFGDFSGESDQKYWKAVPNAFWSEDSAIKSLTRSLNSPGIQYDTKTHEYLGDYLRFLRDYHDINLMSLYNCFNDKIYNNIHFTFSNGKINGKQLKVTFNSQDTNYRIYAIPVKLFADYTIAIDCEQGIELFCGLYNTNLDVSAKAEELAARTYRKIHRTIFKQPFVYDKLNVKNWLNESEEGKPNSTFFIADTSNKTVGIKQNLYTKWDIINREQDLRLFIKVPVACSSSITILEGDFRGFNDTLYIPENGNLIYKNNHCVLNFNTIRKSADTATNIGDGVDLNAYKFKPISRLQLLAFNTGESYPFADRLVEYLIGSVITNMDKIPDNIMRAQKVMEDNKYYFSIDGLWESKMQNIIYDYMINSGPIDIIDDNTIVDRHSGLNPGQHGLHRTIGHKSKSDLYDVLGYVDKDAEKWYASWKKVLKKDQVTYEPVVASSIQSVDIYNGLYDI